MATRKPRAPSEIGVPGGPVPTPPRGAEDIVHPSQTAPAERRRRFNRVELGVTGTPIYSGFILSDPNTAMQFPRSVQVYDKMRRSDGQVQASLLAIMLPILSLTWDVEPHRGRDEKTDKPLDVTDEDAEIAAFIQKDLFAVEDGWDSTLRQILGMLWAGFWAMEKIFAAGDDNLVHLRKLATRLPPSIFRHKVDRGGRLLALEQRGVDPSTGAQVHVEIPAEDLLVFVHNKEGADWTGISVLRSAYKHWYMKDWLYRIGVINVERGGGVPVITLPEDANQEDLQAARDVGESFHLHERAYVIEPGPNYKFRLESVGAARTGNPMDQITHHDQKISANILAQFLDYGDQGGLGNRAGVSEFLDLFLMAEDAVIKNIETTLNEGLIKPWADLNWRIDPVTGGYPKLKAGNIRGFNIRRMGVILRALADGKLVIPDEPLEAFLRQGMGLPEADPKSRREGLPPELASLMGRSGGPPAKPTGAPPGEGDKVPVPGDKGEQKPAGDSTKAPGDAADTKLAEHDFSSTEVRIPAALAARLRGHAAARIAAEDLAEAGLERALHVTVKYGLHAPTVGPVRAALEGVQPFELRLGPTGVFEQAEQDVLYVAVESTALQALHESLTRTLASTQTQPSYVPHLTLASLKKGRGVAYAGDTTFAGATFEARSVWFRPKEDGAAVELRLDGPALDDRTPLDLTAPLWVRRELTALERTVNLHEIDTKTKRAALALLDTLTPIQRDQARAVAAVAAEALDGVLGLHVPYVGRMASAVKKELHDIFEYGRAQVRAELFRQAEVRRARVSPGDASAHGLTLDARGQGRLIVSDHRLEDGRLGAWLITPATGFRLGSEHDLACRWSDWSEQCFLDDPLDTKGRAFDFMGAKADLLAERWAARLKDAAVTAKLRAVRAAMDRARTQQEIEEALRELSDKATRSIVMQTVAEAFALGRVVEAGKLKKRIGQMQYSALLDSSTCPVCAELDGEVGPVDDPRLQTPNPNCVGERYGASCRCITVYELREEDA